MRETVVSTYFVNAVVKRDANDVLFFQLGHCFKSCQIAMAAIVVHFS